MKPIKRICVGAISASIFMNKVKMNGQEVDSPSVQLQRAYKDRSGNWQHTGSLNQNDLPKAVLALQKAYEALTLKGDEGGFDEAIATEDL